MRRGHANSGSCIPTSCLTHAQHPSSVASAGMRDMALYVWHVYMPYLVHCSVSISRVTSQFCSQRWSGCTISISALYALYGIICMAYLHALSSACCISISFMRHMTLYVSTSFVRHMTLYVRHAYVHICKDHQTCLVTHYDNTLHVLYCLTRVCLITHYIYIIGASHEPCHARNFVYRRSAGLVSSLAGRRTAGRRRGRGERKRARNYIISML